jgi:hypothetical protein
LTFTFAIYNVILWRCLQGTLIDTSWLLIYFTILWTFYLLNTSFFFIGFYFFYFISNNNCRLLTTVQVFNIMFDNSAPPSCWHSKWWTNDLRLFFFNIFMQELFKWLFHLPPSEILNWFWIICIWTRYFKTKIWMLTRKTYLVCIFQHRFDWIIPA